MKFEDLTKTDVFIHPWKFAVEPFRIAGGVYYVGNQYVSSFLIDTGDGLILMDTAFPQTLYLLTESIRKLGFDPKNIAYILHSHAHYDHFGGTKALVELTGAKTVMGAADADMIRNRTELTWCLEYGVDYNEPFDTDIRLEGDQVIALGSTRIECVHTPGHTDGCYSFFFDVEEGGKTYRAGTFGGPGHFTVSSEYLDKYNLPRSRQTNYLNSVERMKRERVDIVLGVHPGQFDPFGKLAARTEASNPFINPDEWMAFLESMLGKALAGFGDSAK